MVERNILNLNFQHIWTEFTIITYRNLDSPMIYEWTIVMMCTVCIVHSSEQLYSFIFVEHFLCRTHLHLCTVNEKMFCLIYLHQFPFELHPILRVQSSTYFGDSLHKVNLLLLFQPKSTFGNLICSSSTTSFLAICNQII